MITKAELRRHHTEENKNILFQNPKYRQARAIKLLFEALPKEVNPFFKYGAVERNKLVLYFIHPIVAIGFAQQKNDILAKMRIIYKEKNLKRYIFFTDVIAKTKHQSLPKKEVQTPSIERAKGTFIITSTDPKIRKKFEGIKERIKELKDV